MASKGKVFTHKSMLESQVDLQVCVYIVKFICIYMGDEFLHIYEVNISKQKCQATQKVMNASNGITRKGIYSLEFVGKPGWGDWSTRWLL